MIATNREGSPEEVVQGILAPPPVAGAALETVNPAERCVKKAALKISTLQPKTAA